MKTLLTVIIVLYAASLSAQTEHLSPVPDPQLQKMNEDSQRHHNYGIAKCVIEIDKDTPEYVVESLCGPADKRSGELGQVAGQYGVWKTTSIYDFGKDGYVAAGYARGKLLVVVSSKNIAEAIKLGTFFEKTENPPGTAYSLEKSLEDDR
jgi:hypothetical protein